MAIIDRGWDPRSWPEFPFQNLQAADSENKKLSLQQAMEKPIGPIKCAKLITLFHESIIPVGASDAPQSISGKKVLSEDFEGLFRWHFDLHKISAGLPLDAFSKGGGITLQFGVTGSGGFYNDPQPLSTLCPHVGGTGESAAEYVFERQAEISYTITNYNPVSFQLDLYLKIWECRR
jgi:hypothetical protein